KLRIYLAERMGTYLQEMARSLQKESLAESDVFTDGFVPALLAAQLVDILTWWLEQESPYSPRLIATYYHRLRRSLLKEVGTWE
ncbi:MAG: TetR/AcrR family transcriptional regulator, partial [Ktedonobacteraceae bacterium]|nr:TetR/AcrR family transcriptional regulator [Ktedonobacteraceae bacterium]